jgi:hypothetical protein
MKIKKLVKVTVKSDFMDVQATMDSSKATGYVRRLRKIHEGQLNAFMVTKKITYRKGMFTKTRTIKELPEGISPNITLKIEPAGEIID